MTANEYREMLNFDMAIIKSSYMILMLMSGDSYVTRPLKFLFAGQIQVSESPK